MMYLSSIEFLPIAWGKQPSSEQLIAGQNRHEMYTASVAISSDRRMPIWSPCWTVAGMLQATKSFRPRKAQKYLPHLKSR